MESTICYNLDEAIEEYKLKGYRLDMISPADAPREALMSRGDELLRVRVTPSGVNDGERLKPSLLPDEWIRGRAGMEYRDLLPGRLDGRLIVSNIRLTEGGEVPDYVHYHKVEFQMIYCKRGRIRVVYEDQGPPFWLETGDLVLQPPEIRHRVLYADAGAEVIEAGSPAEHETWVEHDITLPTAELMPDRDFSGQRFAPHVAGNAADGERDTGIAAATNGVADVRIVRENGIDVKLLLTLRGLGSEGDSPLAAPISLEIPV